MFLSDEPISISNSILSLSAGTRGAGELDIVENNAEQPQPTQCVASSGSPAHCQQTMDLLAYKKALLLNENFIVVEKGNITFQHPQNFGGDLSPQMMTSMATLLMQQSQAAASTAAGNIDVALHYATNDSALLQQLRSINMHQHETAERASPCEGRKRFFVSGCPSTEGNLEKKPLQSCLATNEECNVVIMQPQIKTETPSINNKISGDELLEYAKQQQQHHQLSDLNNESCLSSVEHLISAKQRQTQEQLIRDAAASAYLLQHQQDLRHLMQLSANDVDAPQLPAMLSPTTPCGGCHIPICDQHFLLVGEQSWHVDCARCTICGCNVEKLAKKCYAKDGELYCRSDYITKFVGQQRSCERCSMPIQFGELVMNARSTVFHVSCFTCTACAIPLRPGDRFITTTNCHGGLFCRTHFDHNIPPLSALQRYPDQSCSPPVSIIESTRIPVVSSVPPICCRTPSVPLLTPSVSQTDLTTTMEQQKFRVLNNHNSTGSCLMTDSPRRYQQVDYCSPEKMMYSSSGRPDSSEDAGSDCYATCADDCHSGSEGIFIEGDTSGKKPKRMRTSFKHFQLRMMKGYFNINHNPDAKQLKHLANKTSLSKRVLQVWFQNMRAKFRRSQQMKSRSVVGSGGGGMMAPAGNDDNSGLLTTTLTQHQLSGESENSRCEYGEETNECADNACVDQHHSQQHIMTSSAQSISDITSMMFNDE